MAYDFSEAELTFLSQFCGVIKLYKILFSRIEKRGKQWVEKK